MTDDTAAPRGDTAGNPQRDDDGLWEDNGTSLFEGDCGQLAQEVRRALVAILKRRYISAEREPDVWRVMTENRTLLESRLNDMFLQLVVDRDYGVAYKRQAIPDGGGAYPTLLHNLAYTREQTVLMVHLRGLFRSATSAGEEAVFVDGRELADEAANYLPASTTNHVEAQRAAERAVDALAKSDILLETAERGRYRISPIIEVLLPVGRLVELAESLARQNAGPSEVPATAGRVADEEVTA
ncbi:DUF4194 domain-containing protein [Trebonia kvetii]|uniref:DUF4194 domain-containing protein n=1 Tax=Trebonia kvetii TaxID=2480626 RepID=A0A6P2C0T1_9ACTN|nr:DUF4194 domain-containing protein [Trebonia kvetii]TVZ05029.1 DUF4194 domain-containing protein [Trebonia kvetii]